MAVPKRRRSKSKVRSRRAHQAIGKPNLSPCFNCGSFIQSHKVCPTCGHYNRVLELAPKIKKPKKTEE
ncbi:MAG: 50S ribosomal protein L32 [Leptospiraceae bacterium]|nr:50S ribosomal protein L32 [Leptospiraceae bacterium]MCK6380689.1 50S ribosomal protein L32 [Leptospiraceae bacterium]NUO79180.1 50S ribosomal protein L32 [candidate division KSB1 bacterium]